MAETVVDQALAVMDRAKQEIFALRAENADMLDALRGIVKSASDGRDVPEWLEERVKPAKRVIARVEARQAGVTVA